jgi:hypothetical protein
MALFGVGSSYDGRELLDEFLALGAACVGWTEAAAPPLHGLLRALKAGDLVYVKSFDSGTGLTLKAVGVVRRGEVRDYGRTGKGVPVRWAWQGEHRLGKPDDKWPVRSAALYEEFHPAVHAAVIDLVLSRGPAAASGVAARAAELAARKRRGEAS